MTRLPDAPESVALLQEYLEALTCAGLLGVAGELAHMGVLDDAIEPAPVQQRWKPYRELLLRDVIRITQLDGTPDAKRSLILGCVVTYLGRVKRSV